MTAKITASTSSGLVLDSDMSGSLALVANGITVATLNGTGANSGIQLGTSMAPAFSAYATSSQTVSSAVFTKVALQAEEFDTANCFDATTNYRFTPNVAGYYQFSSFVSGPSNSTQNQITAIYKNGSIYKYLGAVQNLNATAVVNDGVSGSMLISLNGSTDYVELWLYQQTGSTVNTAGTAYLTGFLARSA